MRSLSVIRLRVVRSLRWWRFEWARRVEIPVVIVIIFLFIVLGRSVEPFAGLKRGATAGRASSRSRSKRQGSFRLMLLRLVMGFLGRLLLVWLDLMQFRLPVGIGIWLLAVRIVSVLFRLLLSIVLLPRIALRGRVEFRSWARLGGRRTTNSLILWPMGLLAVLVIVDGFMVLFRPVVLLRSLRLFRLVVVQSDFFRTVRWRLMMVGWL